MTGSITLALKIKYFLASPNSILDLRPRALPDVPANVDHIDGVRHVDLALVHVVQHLLRPLGPHLLVPAVPEQPYADDNVSRQRQALLRFEELLLETRAAAEGDDWVFSDHGDNYPKYTSFSGLPNQMER